MMILQELREEEGETIEKKSHRILNQVLRRGEGHHLRIKTGEETHMGRRMIKEPEAVTERK